MTKETKKTRTTKPLPKGTTRADQIWSMVSRAKGASVEEIVTATGMQKHSVRAVLSVEKRKRGIILKLRDGRYVTEVAQK